MSLSPANHSASTTQTASGDPAKDKLWAYFCSELSTLPDAQLAELIADPSNATTFKRSGLWWPGVDTRPVSDLAQRELESRATAPTVYAVLADVPSLDRAHVLVLRQFTTSRGTSYRRSGSWYPGAPASDACSVSMRAGHVPVPPAEL